MGEDALGADAFDAVEEAILTGRLPADWSPERRAEDRRRRLRTLAEHGDVAAIAEHLLHEGLMAFDTTDDGAVVEQITESGLPPTAARAARAAFAGCSADLLRVWRADALTFVGWVTAMANGAWTADDLGDWAAVAFAAALEDPERRVVPWSSIQRGDLLVGRHGGELVAAIATSDLACVTLTRDGLVSRPPMDVVGGPGGPIALKDTLWFWPSYGSRAGADERRPAPSAWRNVPDPAATVGRRGAVVAATAAVLLALAGGAAFSITASESADVPDAFELTDDPIDPGERWSTNELPLLETEDEPAGTVMACKNGTPTTTPLPHPAVRITRLTAHRAGDRALLVEASFTSPLDESLEQEAQRAVRGYRIDDDDLVHGEIAIVERNDGDTTRGRLDTSGEPIPDSEDTVAVSRTFQFLVDLPSDAHPFRVRVDSAARSGAADEMSCFRAEIGPFSVA